MPNKALPMVSGSTKLGLLICQALPSQSLLNMTYQLPVEFFALVFGCSKSADAKPSDVCDFNYSSLRFMVNSCLIYNGEHPLSKGEGCQHH